MGDAVTFYQCPCGGHWHYQSKGSAVTQVETERALTPAQQDWVDALKSADYPQAKGGLCRTIGTNLDGSPKVGYCCLGVLSDRAIKAGAVQAVWAAPGPDIGESSAYRHTKDGIMEGAMLPFEVQEYLCVSNGNPSVPSELIYEAVPSRGPVGPSQCTCAGCTSAAKPMTTASTLNDSLGYTLPEIGAIFELAFKRGAVQ